jgi:hypothetical protein
VQEAEKLMRDIATVTKKRKDEAENKAERKTEKGGGWDVAMEKTKNKKTKGGYISHQPSSPPFTSQV